MGEAGNGVAIGLSRLEIEFKNNSIFSSDIVGKILFPFSDRPIEIEATYESDGILAIKAKGEVISETVSGFFPSATSLSCPPSWILVPASTFSP